MRPKLAIAIPTYHRSGEIGLNNDIFMRECVELGVTVHISDDSTDERTEVVAQKASRKYGNVIYRRNTPSFGHDRNIVETLLWPDAEYVWILGDTFSTLPGRLKLILDSLEGQDLQFVNWKSSDTRIIAPLSGSAAVDLVREKLWHQTLTGGTIYHARVGDWARASPPTIHQNFPHLDIILGYTSHAPIVASWYGQAVLQSAPKKSSYWHHKALDVFVDDWFSVLGGYPDLLSPDQIISIGKSHSANTGLFDAMFLVRLRALGHFGWSSTKKPHFWDAMHIPRAKIAAIALTPRIMVELAAPLKRGFSATTQRVKHRLTR